MRMSGRFRLRNESSAALPKDVVPARERWTRAMQEDLERAKPLGGMPAHAHAFRGRS
jgi:cation/acetate symporter